MNKYLLLPISLLILLSSCREFSGRRIRGNGKLQTESRVIGAFEKLEVEGNIQVLLRQDSTVSAAVTADENLLPYVEVFTEGNTLVIRPKDNTNLRSRHEIRVAVSNAVYRELSVSGASSLTSETVLSDAGKIMVQVSGASKTELQLQAPRVDAELDGASTLTLKGQTRDFDIRASGASDARCFELLSENSKVDVSGASTARVFASVRLEVDASGASTVKYRGKPEIDQRVSGASSVRQGD